MMLGDNSDFHRKRYTIWLIYPKFTTFSMHLRFPSSGVQVAEIAMANE
jgi:hypothetical protein